MHHVGAFVSRQPREEIALKKDRSIKGIYFQCLHLKESKTGIRGDSNLTQISPSLVVGNFKMKETLRRSIPSVLSRQWNEKTYRNEKERENERGIAKKKEKEGKRRRRIEA